MRKKEESKDNFLVLGLSNQQCNNWERTGRSKFIVENQPFDLALACTCFGIKQPGPHLRICRLLAGWTESACKAGDPGSIPGWERSPGERDRLPAPVFMGFPGGSDGKESTAVQETRFDSWVGKIPRRRTWQLTPVFLPGVSPWTDVPRGLQSPGSKRVRHSRATKHSWVVPCGSPVGLLWCSVTA